MTSRMQAINGIAWASSLAIIDRESWIQLTIQNSEGTKYNDQLSGSYASSCFLFETAWRRGGTIEYLWKIFVFSVRR